MDFLRLILLLALLLYGAAATERARLVIRERQKACTVADQELTSEDRIFIRHVARLASMQAASIVVQDGILLGTGFDRIASMLDPAAHAETEAIRDACREAKTSVLENGVLYTSRKPCAMCLSSAAQTGIRKVCFPSITAPRDSMSFFRVPEFN